MYLDSIPILRPGILVLTKIKRCVQYIGSTRPKSVSKFRQDTYDIEFLLHWLARNNQMIDFAGFSTLTPGQVVRGGAAISRLLEREEPRRVGHVIRFAPRASRSGEDHGPLTGFADGGA